MNARRFALVLGAALLALGPAMVSAQGLNLRLSTEESQVAAGEPLEVKMEAVAFRTLELPAAPVFLVDDGKGARTHEARSLQGGERIAVTPDHSYSGGFELALPGPGTYKVQAEYRVGGRVVRSNKLKVEVLASGAARAAK